ncbi:MAG: protoglobin domain-containing protein [Kofleriaceae bacterium]
MTRNPLDELFAYIGFDDLDVARLRVLHPVLHPFFPTIADRFYDAVWSDAKAAAVLTGPEQIERLRVTLIDWMSTGLLGPFDDRFYEKRSRIGRRHVEIGLQHQYMFTAMNVVRSAYSDLIAKLLPAAEAWSTMRSVNKLLDIELAIMVRHYQLDSDERLLARERTIQADRINAVQTLAAGLAHEVRNPLNSAKLQLELLERRLRRAGDDPKLIEPGELARTEIKRLTALLNDFLAFARPPELNTEQVDVATIVRQVTELERISAERRGAALTLGRCPAQLVADVDAHKVHQIVLNLVRNAIEAVHARGRVVVELDFDAERFHVRVRDDGPGIADSVRGRIYEPFFSTKEGGTGLGMSIVHSLVTLHGGTIELETSSEGTRFDIAIPLRRDRAA